MNEDNFVVAGLQPISDFRIFIENGSVGFHDIRTGETVETGNIGLSADQCEVIADLLCRALAPK